jgi:hypothetical protein
MIVSMVDLDALIRIKPNKGTLRIQRFYRWAQDQFGRYASWLDDLEFANWLLGLCILAAALSVRRCVQNLVLRLIRLFRIP